MGDTRAERRRQDRAINKNHHRQAEPRSLMVIEVPNVFLDLGGSPWTFRDSAGQIHELDFLDVLSHTLRFAPVGSGGASGDDAQRVLDLIYHIEASDGRLEFPRDDYDWVCRHLKQYAHVVWNTGDGAYLTRWIQNHAFAGEANVEQVEQQEQEAQ